MNKENWRGQNLLDKINDIAVWVIIAVIILGIFLAGRDFIWYVMGAICLYGVIYYLAQREIELRYYKTHGGEKWVDSQLDEGEGKGEEVALPIKAFFKWEDLTPYEKQLVENFVIELEEKASEIENQQNIVQQLVSLIEIQPKKKEVKMLNHDEQEEEN